VIPSRRSLGLIGALALALVLPSFVGTPAAAARNINYTLYGSSADGWGFASTNLQIPGPTITVVQGDNVTLFLNSVDSARHNWFIDYDNDSRRDANEPRSPNFQTVEVKWNFTANQNGTFVYRSQFDAASMYGTLVVGPPGSGPLSDASGTLIAVGVIVLIVVAVGVAVMMWRQTRVPPPPPT